MTSNKNTDSYFSWERTGKCQHSLGAFYRNILQFIRVSIASLRSCLPYTDRLSVHWPESVLLCVVCRSAAPHHLGLSERKNFRPILYLLNESPCFHKSPGWFHCTVSERPWSFPVPLLTTYYRAILHPSKSEPLVIFLLKAATFHILVFGVLFFCLDGLLQGPTLF